MSCGWKKKVTAAKEGCKKGRIDVVGGRTMGRNMLTNNRTHACIGITKYKERELPVKDSTYITKMLPPSFTLGNRHLFEVSTGGLGLTMGSMKIKKIDAP